MKKVHFFAIVSLLWCMVGISLDASQQEQDPVFEEFGDAVVLNMFKNVKPTEAGKKLFGSDGSPIINDQETMVVLSHRFADAIAIIDLLKSINEAFNKKNPSGFWDMQSFYDQLKLFLVDSKNEQLLNQFLSQLKEKAAALPLLSDDVSNFERAIKNKEPQLFFLAYSTLIKNLKLKFPTLRERLPLARIRKTMWQATTESIKGAVNSIKKAVMLRAKKMYYYLFRKSTVVHYQTWWDESKGKYVIDEEVAEIE